MMLLMSAAPQQSSRAPRTIEDQPLVQHCYCLGHSFVRYLRIWVIWLTYFIGQDDESAVEKF